MPNTINNQNNTQANNGISQSLINPSNSKNSNNLQTKFSNSNNSQNLQNPNKSNPNSNTNSNNQNISNNNNNHYNQNNNGHNSTNINSIKNNNNGQNPNTSTPCPEQQLLKTAYDLYLAGQRDYKNFSLELSLDKFEKAQKIVNDVLPRIQNKQKLLSTTVDFQAKLKRAIENADFQIKNRFEYKAKAGFAEVGESKRINEKIKIMLRDAQEESNKNKNYNYCNNNNIKNANNNYNINNKLSNNYNHNYNQNNSNNINKGNNDKSIVNNELKEQILNEIVDSKPNVKFSDVVGLKEAKQILKEIIIIPNLRPDLFTGLRSPPRGLLLFGPPGTGKTMIAKAVATECRCTFFSISASSLTSKYLGESEKLVRALFLLAFERQPSVVFIDEIESILSKRSDSENDAMKRLKTEFLVQFDGVGSKSEARVLIIGATNRPFDLDPAVIRRLPKRVYIGPFNTEEKKGYMKKIIEENECDITDEQYENIAKMCGSYTNSDIKELCREAAYEPVRELSQGALKKVEKLRPICYDDFVKALKKVRGTLTKDLLNQLEKWNKEFGALN